MFIRISLIALFLSLTFNISANAQQDTTVYELGRVNLPKKFTQSVTIKAAELEKIPFTNVSDVISTWLYGYYGNKRSYLYVVDGNLNTDVNALSIFDIEEITMVQNASIYINGALPGQVMLLVKTKINAGRSKGVNFNGQTNIVNFKDYGSGSSYGSTTNLYNQYYLSTYKNTANVNAGISATFQHNAFPASKALTVADKVYTTDRFKFNGYLNAKLGTANKLSITAGFVPQSDEVRITQLSLTQQGAVANALNGNGSQNLIYGNINLVSKIANGLTNKLSVGYQTRKTIFNLVQNQTINNQFSGAVPGYSATNTTNTDSSGRANSFLINNNLSYSLRIGKFSITPDVNFTYKKITDNGSYNARLTTQQPVANYTISRSPVSKASVLLLTPSVALNYNDIILLQGGFQQSLNKDMYSAYKINQTYSMPFANVGVDVLKAAGGTNKDISLLLSGSYAKTLAISAEPFISLSDQIVSFDATRYPYYPSTQFGGRFDQFQAGLAFSMFKNRLAATYNYQIIKSVDYLGASDYYLSSFYMYYQFDKQIHINRFEVNAEVISNVNFKWRTALNISVFKQNNSTSNPTLTRFVPSLPKANFVTGGMVNRFQYKKISAGLDVLYSFNQERYGGSLSSIPGNKYYSINLQNIYAGYSFKTSGAKHIEVYANSRNMLMTNNSTITDNRRFYGLGFKAEL